MSRDRTNGKAAPASQSGNSTSTTPTRKRPYAATAMNMPNYVTTLWRDTKELDEVRQKLFRLGAYRDEDRRQEGINQVLVWKARKQTELPLAIESTINLITVQIQEEKEPHLSPQALSLLYASAISRFVTGFCDTRNNIERLTTIPSLLATSTSATSLPVSNPISTPTPNPPTISLQQSMDLSAKDLKLPPGIIEIRHSIVHGTMPPLSLLKKSANQSLEWLWSWYWARLEPLISGISTTTASLGNTNAKQQKQQEELHDALSRILKKYTQDRKTEIRDLGKTAGAAVTTESGAAKKAAKAILSSFNGSKTGFTPPPSPIPLLCEILVGEGMIVPRHRSLQKPAPLSGAFHLWTPLLRTLSLAHSSFFKALVESLVDALGKSKGDLYPARVTAFLGWLKHVLVDAAWEEVRRKGGNGKVVWDVRVRCVVEGEAWGVELLKRIEEGDEKSVFGKIAGVLEKGKGSEDGYQHEEDSENDEEDQIEDRDGGEKDDGSRDIGEVSDMDMKTGSPAPRKALTRWEGRWERRPIGV